MKEEELTEGGLRVPIVVAAVLVVVSVVLVVVCGGGGGVVVAAVLIVAAGLVIIATFQTIVVAEFGVLRKRGKISYSCMG